MAQPALSPPSPSSSDTNVLQLTVNAALTKIEEHADQKDKAVLRALLEYAPSDSGRFTIAHHILKPDAELDRITEFYWVNVILTVRAAGIETPAPSQNLAQGDLHGDEMPNVEHSERNQKDLKEHTLARDDYRCLATGKIDDQVVTYKPDFVAPQFAQFDVTHVVHIIPPSLIGFDGKDKDWMKQANICLALQRFCGDDISTFWKEDTNSMGNVMTLSKLAHKYFSRLQFAFEAIPDVAGKYKLVTFGKKAPKFGFPETVTLNSATGQPLPNPFYLAVHCAICKVFWESGRAEAFEKMFCCNDIDDMEGNWEVMDVLLQWVVKTY